MPKAYPNTCKRCGKPIPSWQIYCGHSCSATRDDNQKFWSNVEITDLFGCWEWTATKDKRGYGKLSVENKVMRTHRYSYLINIGPIPDDLFVLHRCNNTSCVNPSHLYLGTQQNNMDDKVRANRQSHAGSPGEKNGSAVLTEVQVIEIIELLKTTNLSQQKIADKYSVGQTTISQIKLNSRWSNVPR